MTAPVAADMSSWEFDAGELPDLWPEPRDSLIVGLLPEPLRPGSDRQDMLLCDLMAVDTDVMVGAVTSGGVVYGE